jgi:hypothetical protein
VNSEYARSQSKLIALLPTIYPQKAQAMPVQIKQQLSFGSIVSIDLGFLDRH